MNVIGLDLSLTATGLSDGTRTWTIRSKGHKIDTLADRANRLRLLAAGIADECSGAELVVIEGPAFASSSGHAHDRSGLWWLVIDTLWAEGIAMTKFVEVPPSVLKKYATGRGNADKGAMIEAACKRFPNVETGGHDGRVDALWLAAMGRDYLSGAGVVPAAQRAMLDRCAWPRVAA